MTTTEPVEPEGTPAPDAIDPADHARLALENTLLRAGVDLESPQGKLVQDAWTGKAPDLEAIKVQWEMVKPPPPPAEPLPAAEQRIDGEVNQAGERRDLSAQSVVEPNPEDKDPRAAAVQAGLDVLIPPPGVTAGTRDDAQAAVLHTLLDAASNGDARVLVDESRAS